MKTVKNKWAKLIATGLGSGLSPIAPGTAGSLLAFLISLAFLRFLDDPIINYLHILLTIGSFIKGIIAIRIIDGAWGKDPSKIVIDEFCGMWLALVFCPANVYIYLLAFGLFRLFDITKPWGVRHMDQLESEWGIMLDDVVAGLYAGMIIIAAYHLGWLDYII